MVQYLGPNPSLPKDFVTKEFVENLALPLGEDVESVPDPTLIRGPVGQRLAVPTHAGTGNESTHPSVLFFPEKWNGYKYWMLHTPYPQSNDDHEDPNLAVSQDGITWINPPGVTNPLDNADGTPEYNSDTDLVMGPNNTMYATWRMYDSNSVGSEEQLYYRSSTDGVNWTPKVRYYTANQSTRRVLSPSLVFEDDHWDMWFVDLIPTPNVLYYMRSANADLSSTWTTPTACSVGTLQTGKEPWHVDVIKHAGRYVGILNDTDNTGNGFNGDLNFITSSDGITWTNGNGPIIPRFQSGQHDQLYRACLIPAIQNGMMGYRVWYGAKLSNTWGIFRTWVGPLPPIFRVTAVGGGTVNVAASTWVLVPGTLWPTPEYNRGFSYSNGVLTVLRTGIYNMSVGINYPSGGTAGRIFAQVLKNSTTPGTGVVLGGNLYGSNLATFSGFVSLTAGDALRVYTNQESGITKAITNEIYSHLALAYFGES